MKKQNEGIESIGVGEKLQYLVREFNDNTVRCQLLYPSRISEKIMEEAVLYVVRGIDVLHSSFISEKEKHYWNINHDISAEDCFCTEHTEGDPIILSDRAMLKSIKHDSKSQLFCTLSQGKNESALTIIISHLCVDGGDAKYLLEKITDAYNLIVQGENINKLVLKNGSRSTLQVYDNLSKKEFLAAFKGSMPAGKSPFPFPDMNGGTPHLVKQKLDTVLVGKLQKYSKEHSVTLNDLLLTAFYKAYLNLPGAYRKDAVAIVSMMDLRRHRKNGESDGLCNMSGMLPTVLRESINGSFEDTLKEISAQTKAAKEDPITGLHGLPMIHVMAKLLPMSFFEKNMGKAYGNMSTGMMNLGYISEEKLIIEGICPKEVVFAGPLKKKPGMQIAATGFGGSITLVSIGEYTNKDVNFISDLMMDMVNKLESAVFEVSLECKHNVNISEDQE